MSKVQYWMAPTQDIGRRLDKATCHLSGHTFNWQVPKIVANQQSSYKIKVSLSRYIQPHATLEAIPSKWSIRKVHRNGNGCTKNAPENVMPPIDGSKGNTTLLYWRHMGVMAFQIFGNTNLCSTVNLGWRHHHHQNYQLRITDIVCRKSLVTGNSI